VKKSNKLEKGETGMSWSGVPITGMRIIMIALRYYYYPVSWDGLIGLRVVASSWT
jgi:hypothetical protein